MSFKRTFYKNITNVAAYTYLSQGIEFLSTIVLSRLLLPEEYGIVAIINLFGGFIQLFANAGIGQSLIRSDYGPTFHRHLFNLSVWLGMLLSIMLASLAFPIAAFFDDPRLLLPTIVMSARFLTDSFNYIPSAYLAKKLKFKAREVARLIATSFAIVLMIILAFAGFSYWALVIPMTVSPLIQYRVLYNKTGIKIKIYGIKAAWFTLKKIKGLMGNLTIINTIRYGGQNIDKLIIGKLYTVGDLGIYNRAFRFSKLSNKLVVRLFGSILFPSLKKLQEGGGDINSEYKDTLGILSLILFPISAVLIAIPGPLVSLLWGQNWIGVAYFMPFIGIIIIFQSLMGTISGVFLVYRKERNMTYVTLFTSLVYAASIIVGSFYSIQMIIILVTSTKVLVSAPIFIYFGFYKAFKFPIKTLVWFWLPKIVISSLLIYGIIMEEQVWIFFLLGLLLLHIILDQRHTIFSVSKFLRKYLRAKLSLLYN